jgi:hypothetical protein
MAVQNTALLVFLFPVVIGMAFGAFVLSGVLTQPGRELNMWPFESTTPIQTENKDINIQGLLTQYSISAPIEIKVVSLILILIVVICILQFMIPKHLQNK